MNDNAFENKNAAATDADNMAQNTDMPEAHLEPNAEGPIDENFEVDEQNDLENETLEKLQLELQESKDRYLRLVAEFDNFRKRNAKEKIEMSKTANKEIVEALLVVLDDIDRASKQFETATDIAAVKEGTMLVFNKLRHILQHKGLKAMDATNQAFDADLHEAITEVPAPKPDMVGKVVDMVEPGYYLNDKLIRHAKVVVGK